LLQYSKYLAQEQAVLSAIQLDGHGLTSITHLLNVGIGLIFAERMPSAEEAL
jgi:hypothetical protein